MALVAIIGMLPIAVQTMGSAEVERAQAKILMHYQLLVQNRDSSELGALEQDIRYFDSHGKLLDSAAVGFETRKSYRVEIEAERMEADELPGLTVASNPSPASNSAELYVVQVQIREYPGGDVIESQSLHVLASN
ncbi:MAG: hypothetical protein AAGK14_06210 [Verrucomicrobiota bacterium]